MFTGHLDEIFLSIQGEGRDLGRPHVFCRLGGCPLRCVYCDTPRSWKEQKQFELHGCDNTQLVDNPVSADKVVEYLTQLLAVYDLSAAQVCLSLTGGEALQQPEFAAQIASLWPGSVLLETSGSDADAFKEIAHQFDTVSLDWKTRSLMSKQLFAQHQDCLRHAVSEQINTQLKMVLSCDTTELEINEMYDFVDALSAKLPIFLQPLTKVPKSPAPPTSAQMLKWLTIGVQRNLDVRVVPQVHPILEAK